SRFSHIWRRGEIDKRFRAFLGGDREVNSKTEKTRDQAAALIAEAGGDETWMQAIGGNARAMQAAGELAREQNVAKLGAAVGFHRTEILYQLKVVEIEPRSSMRTRRGVDDTRGRRGLEPFAQTFGDHEIGHVVQREGIFEPIPGELPAAEHSPRIVDQDVNARLTSGDLSGHALHLWDARQIGVMDRVGEAGCPFAKPRQCRLPA